MCSEDFVSFLLLLLSPSFWCFVWASLVAQMVKNPSAMWETWVLSLGWEDPLEEGMATHSSILAWRIPIDRGAWRATYSPWGHKELDTTEPLSTAQCPIQEILAHSKRSY